MVLITVLSGFVSFFLECERSERGSGMPLSRCHRFVIIGHDNSATSIVILIVVGREREKCFVSRAVEIKWRIVARDDNHALQFTEGYNFNLNEKGERDFID